MDAPSSLLTPELSFAYIQIFEKKTCKVSSSNSIAF